MNGRLRLGELLLTRGKLTRDKLDRALRLQEESGERLGLLLTQFGDASERDVTEALSVQLELPLAQFEAEQSFPDVGDQITPDFMQRSRFVPLSMSEAEMVVAMEDPSDAFTLSAIELATGKRVRPCLATPSEITTALKSALGARAATLGEIVDGGADERSDEELSDIQHLRELASEAPIIRVVNALISSALAVRASDIHVEPFDRSLRVRYRVDGVLRDGEAPPSRSAAAVISRIKVMAKLDISERRLPQDGRIKLRMEGREMDLRVSTVPTLYGESVVLRILDKSRVPLDFDSLGFSAEVLPAFSALVERPYGIILVTGPTGSGKTTTLYAALVSLNSSERKLLTVEDPVEYQLDGINQIQVKPRIGLSFANALRSILRQDPDVIMVGEMRDAETANIAVQAALTGHKVFSTLHTNDAASSITRLLDMGVEDFLLTSTVTGVLAQRLVRTLCHRCKSSYRAPADLYREAGLIEAGVREVILHRPGGCPHCDHTGYQGRTCVAELMVLGEPLREAILARADAVEIQHIAAQHGMVSMYRDGLRKALAGDTTPEEVVRVTQEP